MVTTVKLIPLPEPEIKAHTGDEIIVNLQACVMHRRKYDNPLCGGSGMTEGRIESMFMITKTAGGYYRIKVPSSSPYYGKELLEDIYKQLKKHFN